MLVIRIGPRTLAFLGMALALVTGLTVGSLRPADFALAAGRGAATAEILAAAPSAQGAATLSLDQANRAIQGSIAYARENGYRMSFVVVDASGTVVASAKMDGSGPLIPTIAQGGALVSATFGRPSGAVADGFANNPAFWTSVIGMGRGFVLARGALPIVLDGVGVGAMAGSGGTAQQDEDAARAGLQAAGLE